VDWADEVIRQLVVSVEPAAPLSFAARSWSGSTGLFHLVGDNPPAAKGGRVVCLSACEEELLDITGIPPAAETIEPADRCPACYALRG
jgi:hypothetical protein